VKKLIAILCLTIYASTGFGMGLKDYFCAGRDGGLGEISCLKSPKEKKCSGGHEKRESTSCCNGGTCSILSDNIKAPQQSSLNKPASLLLKILPLDHSYVCLACDEGLHTYLTVYSTPRGPSQPIFLLDRAFRI
jgi:hypothetical protein